MRLSLPPLLARYLGEQRWFGGKARQIRSVEIADVVPFGETALEAFVLLVRVAYTSGAGETYVVPLVCTQESAVQGAMPGLKVYSAAQGKDLHLRNALSDEAFLRRLLEAMEGKTVFRGFEGEIHSEHSNAFHILCDGFTGALQPKAVKSEQSNSSIIYGDRVILKFFRRAEEGENPDLEIGRFLTEKKNLANIPAVAGWLEYHGTDNRKMYMGILQAFVPNIGDAWQFTLNALSSFWQYAKKYSEEHGPLLQHAENVDDGRAESAGFGKKLPEPILTSIQPYLDAVELLGKRTAELHLALASDVDDPAFAPEPFTDSFQQAFRHTLHALTEQNLALLRMKIQELPPEQRGKARELIARQDEMLQKYDAALSSPIQAMRTRIHGDYHLGQVLYTGSDFVVIDFEGEPARALSERRVKRSPLQDVTGMLRSFHYAAFSFHVARQEDAGASQMGNFEVSMWAEAWYACVSERFVSAYFQNAGQACFIPADRDALSTLLRVHLLEKAVYELGYELNNRPGWIAIPVAGISQLLDP